VLATATAVASTGAPITHSNVALPKGKRVQWIGHSFHVFLPTPVAKLAKEAGISHQNLGFDMIPASVPCQHWNKGGSWKRTVQEGKADVMTLATREEVPDPCIPKFVQLAAKSRPDMKVMVQETWLPFSPAIPALGKIDPNNKAQQKSYIDTAAKNIEKCAGIRGCSNRNAANVQTLERTRSEIEGPYRIRLRQQLAGLNRELGRNITILVPLWDATLSLRQLIAQGKVPGLSKQTDLFMDGLGHAKKPLENMASYLWFAALYNQSPVGMKALGTGAQDRVLQQVAWDAFRNEPLRGYP